MICGKSRRGRLLLKRKTRSDRMRAKLQEIKEAVLRQRHQPVPIQGEWLRKVVTGFFAYHAVPDQRAGHRADSGDKPICARSLATSRQGTQIGRAKCFGSAVAGISSVSVAQTTDRTRDAVQYLCVGVSRRFAVSESDLRKHALECVRLAADCMQLVSDVHSLTWQRHFLEMARVWTVRAERGPSVDTPTENSTKRVYQPARGLRDSGPAALQHEVGAPRDVQTRGIRFSKA
jgi:hypothetical protein